MKRLGTALLLVATVGLLAGGAALLWADARLDDAGAQDARVILSGPRVTDVELRREGAGTVRHLQPLTVDGALGIGSRVRVQVIDEPVTVARLAGSDDVEAPAFGTPVGDPVADPESAVAVVLAAAGLPSEPATVTAARFVTR